jgi:hypothetical protein
MTNNYNNGKVYKIEPITGGEEGDIYIGSTIKRLLSQRMSAHRCQYALWKANKDDRNVTSYILFDKYGVKNCQIILLENVNAQNKDELLAREAHWIKTTKNVNHCIPKRTIAEWRKDNEESQKLKRQEYILANKEKIAEQMKISRAKFYAEHKEQVDERNRAYREKNKEKYNEAHKLYYENNKEKFKVINAQVIDCGCGFCYTRGNTARHCKTQRHQRWVNESIQKD